MIEIALFVVILCASCTSGVSPRRYEFERGSEGIVVCPDMVDNGYSADDTEAIYWSFSPKGSSDSPKSIISYFHGTTTPDSNHEQYTIQNSSLVISNVAQSDEGTYSYRYIPWYKAQLDGSVEVFEKVPCKAERPKIDRCSEDQPSCEIELPSDETDLNLTCSVEHVKPAVNIRWFRWCSCSNTWEEIQSTHKFERVTCSSSESDCVDVSGTFNSYATVQISLESASSTFKCETNNTMIEHFNVTVIKAGKYIVTGVTHPTRFSSYEPTSSTTSEPPTSSEHHSIWIYVLSGLLMLSVFIIGILIKGLFHYRTRLLYLEKLNRNTHLQKDLVEKNGVCKVLLKK